MQLVKTSYSDLNLLPLETKRLKDLDIKGDRLEDIKAAIELSGKSGQFTKIIAAIDASITPVSPKLVVNIAEVNKDLGVNEQKLFDRVSASITKHKNDDSMIKVEFITDKAKELGIYDTNILEVVNKLFGEHGDILDQDNNKETKQSLVKVKEDAIEQIKLSQKTNASKERKIYTVSNNNNPHISEANSVGNKSTSIQSKAGGINKESTR